MSETVNSTQSQEAVRPLEEPANEQHLGAAATQSAGIEVAQIPYAFTRTESSRSLEDAELYTSIATLTRLGALRPVSEIDMYHGRGASSDSPKWTVDPSFNNGGNNSGNYNFNLRPSLYTSDKVHAEAFADARSKYKNEDVKPQIHRISSPDRDAVVSVQKFSTDSLNDTDRAAYYEATAVLAPPITIATPTDFKDRDTSAAVRGAIQNLLQGKPSGDAWISQDDIADLSRQMPASTDAIQQLAGSYNARQLFVGYMPAAIHEFGRQGKDYTMHTSAEGTTFPVNHNYIAAAMRNAHIIGEEVSIKSATLNKVLTATNIYDLEKVNSLAQNTRERFATQKRFGSLAHRLHGAFEWRDTGAYRDVINTLTDAHANPEFIIGALKDIPDAASILEADAGNWEGFTLEEHYRTVLDNFDNNFADKLPADLLAPMRLAILGHDLGKPIAHKAGRKADQDRYNEYAARKLYETIELDPNVSEFLLSIIGPGAKLTAQIAIHNNMSNVGLLRATAETAYAHLGVNHPSEEEIKAYIDLCEILITCDGGAYTDKAVTHDARRETIYRNAQSSFQTSFKPSVGITGRDIALKHGNVSARLPSKS